MRVADFWLSKFFAAGLFLLAGCPSMGTTDGPGTPVDLSVDASPCSVGDAICDPNCKTYSSPSYCVGDHAPMWLGCGPCSNVGYTCNGCEYGMTCECDHKWHFTYRPDCHSAAACEPAGGFTCTDGG